MLSSQREGEIVEVEREEIGTQNADTHLNSIMGAKEKIIPCQSLPRDSKIKHKVLGDKPVEKAHDASLSDLNKRKSRLR